MLNVVSVADRSPGDSFLRPFFVSLSLLCLTLWNYVVWLYP